MRITKLSVAVGIVALLTVAATSAYATHVFNDVNDGRFYAEPAEWAADNGITVGCGDGNFCPEDPVTRGENITFAKRYDDNIVQPKFDELDAKDTEVEAKADAATAAANANAAAIAALASGIYSDEVTFSVASGLTVEALAISIDAPGPGTLLIELAGSYFFDNDAAGDDASTLAFQLGLCDETASFVNCGDGPHAIFHQDADDGTGLNDTPGYSIVRAIDVAAAGPVEIFVNGTTNSGLTLDSWDSFLTVTYIPGSNALDGAVTVSS